MTNTDLEEFESELGEKPTDEVYVNVYLYDRAYGGPEEGGWYFDTFQILRVIPTIREHAEEIKARMMKSEDYSNEGRYPVSSVLSEGEYVFYIEDRPGESEPEYRPHYE